MPTSMMLSTGLQPRLERLLWVLWSVWCEPLKGARDRLG